MHPLTTYRASKGITLRQLAAAAGTTSATLCRIERRRLRPSLALIERITRATNGEVTANDFVASADPEQEEAA